MNAKTNGYISDLKSETVNFLNYMKAKVPVFHNSNVFYRDLENGVIGFYEKKGKHLKYGDAADITKSYLEHLENEKVLIRTGEAAWKVNYTEFITPKPGDPF